MKAFKSLGTIFAASAIACIPILFSTQSASAATGMDGSYIGVGINGDGSGVLPAVTGRIDFKNSPISIRATATGACESDVCATLVIPTVTYDIGVAKDVNIYAGVGGSALTVNDRDVNNKWITDGWWKFSPGDKKFLTIDNSRLVSNNRIFYFYAETTDSGNSLTWTGENYVVIGGKQYGFMKVRDTRGNNNDFSVQCK